MIVFTWDRYRYVNESMIQQWRKENQLFYEGRDRDSYGRSIQVKRNPLPPSIFYVIELLFISDLCEK